MENDPGQLSWVERARRVREGESALADQPVAEPYAALRDLVASMLQRSFDAVVLCTREGEYLEVSNSFCALTGYSRVELLGQTSLSLGLVDPDGVRRRAAIDVTENVEGIYENVMIRKDGTPRIVEFSHQFLDGGLTLVIIRDVTERRQRESELDRLASHDPLTGVLNRRGLSIRIETMLQEARRAGAALHLVVADVDDLKKANDQLGHEFGDQVLVTVAGALVEVFGPDAAVGRLGGDEFAVAVSGGSEDEVALVCKQLHAALAEIAIGPAGAQRSISVSLGASTAEGGIGTVDRLLALADAKQYVVKRARHAVPHGSSGAGAATGRD